MLKGVNLTINPGTVTALVGPSGSGKSTIAKLIAGFWDVTEGNITLGGKDIKEIPLDQLNQEIAYVSQDNYLFDRTIRDNIRMGKIKCHRCRSGGSGKSCRMRRFYPEAG